MFFADLEQSFVGWDASFLGSDGVGTEITAEGFDVGIGLLNGWVKVDDCFWVEGTDCDFKGSTLCVSSIFQNVNGLEVGDYVVEGYAFLGHHSAVVYSFFWMFVLEA